MSLYAQLGADKSKLVMGMPTYGRIFQLQDNSNHGIGAKAGKGQAGKYTKAAGFVAYYEICEYVKSENYKVVQDPEKRIGPYAYSGNQWVGYDDVAFIEHKSKFIKDNGYGGGMIWALDLDDFTGSFCGCGKYPLLSAINRVLRNYQGTQSKNCQLGYNQSQDQNMIAFQRTPQQPFVYSPWIQYFQQYAGYQG